MHPTDILKEDMHYGKFILFDDEEEEEIKVEEVDDEE